jgi:hypothetical protein
MQVIRIGNHVGVRYDIQSQADPFELYNVTIDPKETNNLAVKMPGLEQQMKAMVLQSRRPNDSAPRPYDHELVPATPAVPAANGVEWKAYEGNFPWVPDLETLQPKASGTAERPDLARRTRDDGIGMLFAGYLKIPQDGEYTFFIKADTGALLRIHDATVIDADYGYKGGEEAGGSIRLQAGLHPFRLYYARKTKGKPSLDFAWSKEGMVKEPVPASVFFLKKAD